MTANAQASGATTVIVGPSHTFLANTLGVDQVYRLRASVRYVRVGTAAMNLVFALRVAGSPAFTLAVVTPTVAATYDGEVEAYFTIRSTGSGGTYIASIRATFGGTTQAQHFGGHITDIGVDSINTTNNCLVELVANMSANTASNVLTISQGHVERVF
jgi:hypothetical protein